MMTDIYPLQYSCVPVFFVGKSQVDAKHSSGDFPRNLIPGLTNGNH